MELTVVCHTLSIISCNQMSTREKTLLAIKENSEQVTIREKIRQVRPENQIRNGRFLWVIKICFSCKENKDMILYSEHVNLKKLKHF